MLKLKNYSNKDNFEFFNLVNTEKLQYETF